MPERVKAGSSWPMTWVWMVLALLVVGGFLTWLGVASEGTTVAVVVEEENDGDLGLAVVERDTLAEDRARFVDQTVRVQGVEATGLLGPGIFWGELGDPARQVPILVRMDSALAEQVEVQVGVPYTLTGVVHAMTDELADGWAAAGEFRGEGEHMQAMFADYYIQASGVRPTGGARPQPGG